MRRQNGASLGCWKCRSRATPEGWIEQVSRGKQDKRIARVNGFRGVKGRHGSRWSAHWIVLVCLLVAFGGVLPRGEAQGLGQKTRVVQGRVLDPQGHPQPNAIVYLQNQKTLEVKSYITAKDGNYRFGELSTDVDYQVWAKYQGMKSKTRSISSFDSKDQIHFDLQLEPSKQAAK